MGAVCLYFWLLLFVVVEISGVDFFGREEYLLNTQMEMLGRQFDRGLWELMKNMALGILI